MFALTFAPPEVLAVSTAEAHALSCHDPGAADPCENGHHPGDDPVDVDLEDDDDSQSKHHLYASLVWEPSGQSPSFRIHESEPPCAYRGRLERPPRVL